MKKNQWLYLAIAAGVIWYYWKKKQSKNSVSGTYLQDAKSAAADVVDKMVESTEFKIDNTSFADQYAKEGQHCK